MAHKTFIFAIAIVAAIFFGFRQANACTGITLEAGDGSHILARTIEWGGSDLHSNYVIVPRGYTQSSILPGDTGSIKTGMSFSAQYGYVGLAVEQKEFVAEGLNEVGLSAGLFYFPNYGKYEQFNPDLKNSTISDLQLVSYILGTCKTIDDVKHAITQEIHIVAIDPRASTVHWRFADVQGHQIVLEIIDGTPRFYDNKLGVLTNSPDFNWQMTNLNNYVNLHPGSSGSRSIGSLQMSPFGAGSGFLGIPGDVTPPSRFIRAAFYQTSSPKLQTAWQTVKQCFQILNNFDIPIGIEFEQGQIPADIPSATQWTSATDITNKMIYYRTMNNSTIRCIDLKEINFNTVKYHAESLDKINDQPLEYITID